MEEELEQEQYMAVMEEELEQDQYMAVMEEKLEQEQDLAIMGEVNGGTGAGKEFDYNEEGAGAGEG